MYACPGFYLLGGEASHPSFPHATPLTPSKFSVMHYHYYYGAIVLIKNWHSYSKWAWFQDFFYRLPYCSTPNR